MWLGRCHGPLLVEVFCFFFSKKKFFDGAIWKEREVGDGLRFA
jgi:hypothetical protein